jgi:hypothetical protein
LHPSKIYGLVRAPGPPSSALHHVRHGPVEDSLGVDLDVEVGGHLDVVADDEEEDDDVETMVE